MNFKYQHLGELPLLKRATSLKSPPLPNVPQEAVNEECGGRGEVKGLTLSSQLQTVLRIFLAPKFPGHRPMAIIRSESQLNAPCLLLLLSPPFHRYWSHGHFLVNILQTKKKKKLQHFWSPRYVLFGWHWHKCFSCVYFIYFS